MTHIAVTEFRNGKNVDWMEKVRRAIPQMISCLGERVHETTNQRKISMNILFEGKVALVTGAGSGRGLATAKAFAESGASVALADWNESAVSGAAEKLTTQGHVWYRGDRIGSADVDRHSRWHHQPRCLARCTVLSNRSWSGRSSRSPTIWNRRISPIEKDPLSSPCVQPFAAKECGFVGTHVLGRIGYFRTERGSGEPGPMRIE
jgi:short chain dehydrogenase